MRKFVAIVAVLEVALLVAIVLFVRSGSCRLIAPSALGSLMGGASGGDKGDAGDRGAGAALPSSLPPVTAAPGSGSASDTSGAQNANVSGDLNQVPDPNCVGKTAAGLLNSQASTTPPSCPPMSAPPSSTP